MNYIVYALFDKSKPDIFMYIGMTNNIDRRFKQHLKGAKNRTDIKTNWIKSIGYDNVGIIELFTTQDKRTAYEHENKLIHLYNELNPYLLNIHVLKLNKKQMKKPIITS